MNRVELQSLVGGDLQKKFEKSFEKVIENLQDLNTPFKTKRKIAITISFEQSEDRDNISASIDVTEKLAPQLGMKTKFFVGRDCMTGEMVVRELKKQVDGQISMDDFEETCTPVKIGDDIVDPETGEVIEE